MSYACSPRVAPGETCDPGEPLHVVPPGGQLLTSLPLKEGQSSIGAPVVQA